MKSYCDHVIVYSVCCVVSIEYQLHPDGAEPRSPVGPPAGAGEVFHPVTNAGVGAGAGRGGNAGSGGVPVQPGPAPPRYPPR